MAQAKFKTLLTATTGLNNAVDAVRLAFDSKTGVTELARAVNVDIDDSGRITRRLGRTQRRAEASRSAFVDGEQCLFVAGTSLYRLGLDFSRTLLRENLTAGARMRFWPIADRIYYVNNFERGYVAKSKDNAWEAPDEYRGPTTNRTFSDPPTGHLVSWFAGRALVARGNAIFASEVTQYGRFDLARSFKMEPDPITMLRPLPGGLLVGTTKQVLFYEGERFDDNLKRRVRADVGVLEGSDDWCPAEKLGLEGGDRYAIFTTPKGICTVGPGGAFRNLTEDKLVFPSARYACGRVVGDRYLVLIEP